MFCTYLLKSFGQGHSKILFHHMKVIIFTVFQNLCIKHGHVCVMSFQMEWKNSFLAADTYMKVMHEEIHFAWYGHGSRKDILETNYKEPFMEIIIVMPRGN